MSEKAVFLSSLRRGHIFIMIREVKRVQDLQFLLIPAGSMPLNFTVALIRLWCFLYGALLE